MFKMYGKIRIKKTLFRLDNNYPTLSYKLVRQKILTDRMLVITTTTLIFINYKKKKKY